jgi:hypothetical protein
MLPAPIVVLLGDTRSNGVADIRLVVLEGLHAPYGITLVGDQRSFPDADAIGEYHYRPVRAAR